MHYLNHDETQISLLESEKKFTETNQSGEVWKDFQPVVSLIESIYQIKHSFTI